MTFAPLEHIRLSRKDRVAEIVLDRPESLNAISSALARDLLAATTEVAADPTISVVVITSASERAFCVGADLKERAKFSDQQLLEQRLLFRNTFAGLRDLGIPSIAAVSGFALGGGFEIALSCDIIFADGTAVVGLPEVGVGLVPGCGGTQLLARRVGTGRAADLMYTGRSVDAREALQLGLIDRLSTVGSARDAAFGLGRRIAENSPLALREAKRALRAAGEGGGLTMGLEVEDAAWRAVAASPDRAEGIAAFAGKREPVWPSTQPGGAYGPPAEQAPE